MYLLVVEGLATSQALEVKKMKISCMYCGKIHEKKFDCGRKPKKTYGKRKESDRFRWQQSWKKKREEIKERDNYLCQVCLDGLYPIKDRVFNCENLEVHHIEKIKDRPDLALDNSNLITLDEYHHEMAEKGMISKEYLKKLVAKKEKTSPPGATSVIF